MKAWLIFLLVFVATARADAQGPAGSKNLNRNISAKFINQPLNLVLDKISKQGNFYFSYSGNVMHRDSMINLSVQNRTVKEVLDILFKGSVEYKEVGNYVILKSSIYRFLIEAENIESAKGSYEIDGYVLNQKTREGIKNATVFEKKLLKSTLTDDKGYFKLKFKGDVETIVLTVSKEDYRDTSIRYLPGVTIRPEGYANRDLDTGIYNSKLERFGLSKLLVSSRQRIQSLNIPSFIANSPFQASFLPGLSSHGMLSSQIVNKGSLNVLGGYTAGVDGVEIAGIFNVNKKDVKKFQAAGVLNITGGKVEGFQSAGVLNLVLDSVVGGQAAGVFNIVQGKTDAVQAAGVFNITGKAFAGGQVAGVFNLTGGNFKGMQAAGVINISNSAHKGCQVAGVSNAVFGNLTGFQACGVTNFALKSVEGTQVAGLLNIAGNKLDGVQIASLLNFAKKMNGTQIGLINLADTSSGYSIGLFNLVRKGYHKISISTNDVLNTNLSLKTGNDKLYTILIGGTDLFTPEKVYSAGLGMGHDFLFSRRFTSSLEITSQALYLGNSSYNGLNKLQGNFQFQLFKGITLFAGPAFSVYYSDKTDSAKGYKTSVVPSGAKRLFNNTQCWIGWNSGITLM